MSAALERHRHAILSGNVTKSNVIGLRKALAADWRRQHGYSVSCTAPKVDRDGLASVVDLLEAKRPIVRGDLHASGVRTICGPRYAKRLAPVADKIAALMGFSLVGYDEAARGYFVPIYEAWGNAGKFRFRVIPWQSAAAYGLESGPTLIGGE